MKIKAAISKLLVTMSFFIPVSATLDAVTASADRLGCDCDKRIVITVAAIGIIAPCCCC